jgi:predicted DCC family thiol-disulfide oxidoreductase YuxK
MMPIGMARDPNTWTVLYDRDCGFCRWSLAQLLAVDRNSRLRPVALDTPEADAALGDLTPGERASSWHLISPDGRRWSAGAAAPPLLRLLPGGHLAAAALDSAPAMTERAYRLVADHRSTFSRLIPASAKRRADARIERAERTECADRPECGDRPERADRPECGDRPEPADSAEPADPAKHASPSPPPAAD